MALFQSECAVTSQCRRDIEVCTGAILGHVLSEHSDVVWVPFVRQRHDTRFSVREQRSDHGVDYLGQFSHLLPSLTFYAGQGLRPAQHEG